MIKRVGATDILPRRRATCHCGAVVLELELADGIIDPRHCNCSMCRRKGAIVASVPLAGLHVLRGQESSGIHTHHQRRSNPQEYSDGINHPADGRTQA